MKLLKKTYWLGLAAAAFAPFAAFAQSGGALGRGLNDIKTVQQNAGVGTQTSLPAIIGNIINVLLGFLGIVFLVLLIYAGFLWMTAQGEKGNVEKAQNIIRQSIIGLVVIVAAFAISNFVLGSLINATQ